MRRTVLNGPQLLSTAPPSPGRSLFSQVRAPLGHDWQSGVGEIDFVVATVNAELDLLGRLGTIEVIDQRDRRLLSHGGAICRIGVWVHVDGVFAADTFGWHSPHTLIYAVSSNADSGASSGRIALCGSLA
jgi:hypothetical protein